MTVADMKPGQRARILGYAEPEESMNRLGELGLITGQEISFLRIAPLGDPLEVKVMHYHLSIRKKEAGNIRCELIEQ